MLLPVCDQFSTAMASTLITVCIVAACTTKPLLLDASPTQPTHELASSSDPVADQKLCTEGTGEEPYFHCICEEVNSIWRTCSSLCPVNHSCMHKGCQKFAVEGCPVLTGESINTAVGPSMNAILPQADPIQGSPIPQPAISGSSSSQPAISGSSSSQPVTSGTSYFLEVSTSPPKQTTVSSDRTLVAILVPVSVVILAVLIIVVVCLCRTKAIQRRNGRLCRFEKFLCYLHKFRIVQADQTREDLTEPEDPTRPGPDPSVSRHLLGPGVEDV